MADLVLEEVKRENAATKSSENPPTSETVHELSISDLPLEVMEIIFEELDSINRKRIERVCKGWQQIIRGVSKFRTHLKIEAPSLFRQWQFREYWSEGLLHLVNPDLEVLHFASSRFPDIAGSVRSNSNSFIKRYGIREVMLILKEAGADLKKAEIVFTDCNVDCPLGRNLPTDSRRIRIIRSNLIASGECFKDSSLYFEELWLEAPDKLSTQLIKLYLSEYGPLTKAHSHVLRRFKRCLTIDAETDLAWIHHLANSIPDLKSMWMIEYVDGYNWVEALLTITRGGHVSRHTAAFLNNNRLF